MSRHRADRRNAFNALQAIQMTHGQVLWILSEFGFREGVTPETFNYYIKSLRKLGIPFVRREAGLSAGRLAQYSFNHVMELSVVLSLRVYGILPDLVIGSLIRSRRRLYDAYRKAYLESDTGTGAPIVVVAEGVERRFTMRGVYLDLQLAYSVAQHSAGQLVSVGPPRILAPFEALEWFATAASPARASTSEFIGNRCSVGSLDGAGATHPTWSAAGFSTAAQSWGPPMTCPPTWQPVGQ